MTNFIPSGYRILIRIEEVEETTDSGIVVVTHNQKEREERGNDIGTVLRVGPSCWQEPKYGDEPWCKPKDRVMFPKYAGHHFKEQGVKYAVMNDEDILGRWSND